MNKKNFKNPDAYRNYDIKEEIEVGIVLKGSEVKSIRNGNASLKDTYAIIKKSEMYILNMYIKPYEHGANFNPDSTRMRKLLLHKKEILKIQNNIKKERLSLIPIKMYFKKNKVKILLGIGKGKKLHDKRQDMAKKDAEMKINRIKNRYI